MKPVPPSSITAGTTSTTIRSITYSFANAGLNSVSNSAYLFTYPGGGSTYCDVLGGYNTTAPYAYTGTATTSGYPNGSWWSMQTSTAVCISGYSFASLQYPYGDTISEWYVLGSTDGSSWSVIDHRAYSTPLTILYGGTYNHTTPQLTTFNVENNTTGYTYHRFVLVAAGGASYGINVANFFFSLGGNNSQPY